MSGDQVFVATTQGMPLDHLALETRVGEMVGALALLGTMEF